MFIKSESIHKLKELSSDYCFDIVGFFPECKFGKENYPAGEIHLKVGFQNERELHNGFGLLHIICGSHQNDPLFSNVTEPNDIADLLKKSLKKHSPIYAEQKGRFIVISTNSVKIVLSYDDILEVYSVITCHSITNKYNRTKHGNIIGRIKKDLN